MPVPEYVRPPLLESIPEQLPEDTFEYMDTLADMAGAIAWQLRSARQFMAAAMAERLASGPAGARTEADRVGALCALGCHAADVAYPGEAQSEMEQRRAEVATATTNTVGKLRAMGIGI